MKKNFELQIVKPALILTALLAMASCNQKPDTPLAKLIEKRDSLKDIRETLDTKIFTLDDKIAELDSTVSRKKVTVVATEPGLFEHYFDVYGNVQSDKTATLVTENPGNVTEILVQEGQEVKKGQVLVRLDQGVFNRNMQELKTQLELATTLYEKQKRLWEQNIGSEVQYLEAKNRKESLENNLATLREQKSKSSVVAPFAGIVDKIFPKVGEMAGMQSPIVRIVNLDQLYITSDVSERYINALKKGDQVKLIINNSDTLISSIARIGKYINPVNRSFEIRVEVDSVNQELRPNSLVAMKINDFTKENAIVLPSSIIMHDSKGKDYVFVVGTDDKGRNVATKTPISTGASYQGKTVVLEGVQAGDQVINKGARTVRDNELINISTIG